MHPDVAWLPATELAGALQAGQVEPQAVVACHLARVARYDSAVGAYVFVDRSARAGSGPLAGVTLAVKDSYPVAGMPWTFGSPKWAGRVADEDAVPVARARAAGAALLGKTNLPELAAAVGTSNELFPPTQNPWRRVFTPGGSSGGSAAAVAAGLCTAALGDDMGGSIRIPAACCGVVGLRPSPGLVEEEHPDPTRLNVRGPLARSVADIRLLLVAMTGGDLGRRGPSPGRSLRIAVVQDTPIGLESACRSACELAAAALEESGHHLTPASWDPLPVAHSYQVVRPASVSTMPGEPGDYGRAAGDLIARGRQITAREYLDALRAGLAAAGHLARLLQDHDFILTPTLGRLPMPISSVPAFLSEEWLSYTQFVLPVSFAGLPALSLPAGLSDGLPVAVQLIGRANGEEMLLDLAEQLESAPGFGFQRPPGFD
jgi:Asp-tRNA(Asn)/Glu-tRNA(Gln) amidotransferase A subunit family amidase